MKPTTLVHPHEAAFESPAGDARLSRPDRRELEIMLTSAQRLAGVGSWIWDVAADRLVWSDETYRVLKLSAKDFGGTYEGFLRQVHPDDREGLRQVVQQAFGGCPHFSYRYRLTGSDGCERVFQGDGESEFDAQGALVRLIGTIMDITERERERAALRESEARFRNLVQLSSDWYWEQDAAFRFTEFSGRRSRQVPPRELLGLRRWEIPGCTPLGWDWQQHREALEARQPFRHLELRITDGMGERHISISGEPFFDLQGAFLGYRGTASDITERKRSEERLRELNASLAMAMRLGRIGAWSLELPQRSISWSCRERMIHAIDGGEAATFDALLERVDPASRPELQGAFEGCIARAESFDIEVQLQAGPHSMKWVRMIGEAHRDAHGQVRQVRGAVQDVTDRRLAAERAREFGARMAVTLDSVTHPFVTLNRDWAFTYSNQEADRMMGRERGELLGRKLWEEFPEVLGTRIEREYRRAMAEGQPAEFDEFYEPLARWLQIKAYPSRQGLAIYFRDITDTQVVQQALADSEDQLRHLFDNTIDGVLYTAADGSIVRVNPAACAKLGQSEADIRGTRLAELVAPGDTRLAGLLQLRGMHGRASGHLRLRHRDGSEFTAEISSAEYAAADGTQRAFVVFRDISERLRAEQEVLQLNSELGDRVRQRTAELEEANAELKAFAHSLAHDLQSPAAAIDAFSELLQSALPPPLPPRAAHYLERIRASARKTGEYAQGMLALAQVSQAQLSVAPVGLSAIARDLLTQLAERDRERRVEWQVQDGLVAPGDATLLRMALENLLGNAWKFTRARETACIAFGAARAEGGLVYHVRDNGAGFDMAYAHKLFGSFQRLHSEAEFPGTGLGLANVQRIIGRHGGRIWAEAVEGQGACFFFTLGPASPPG